MLSGKHRILALFISLFLFNASLILAGTTGKIAGRAVDKDTGEPLPGVSVVIQGTTLGASTDMDGYYSILQVPPGVHTIVATMIGYTPLKVNDVSVHIDQTSTVELQISPQVIEMNSITVVAEKNIVKKDVSTSVAEIAPEEIQSLPVASIDEVVGLQAGVEEGLVIRGGTSDEVLFQIDGVTLRDPRNNKPISTVALGAIQEVSIERGGFNAEYGQVRSGIINIVGKEGSTSSYHGSAQIKYSPYTPKNFGMSVYDPNSMWNRPYLDPAVAWTGTTNGAWDLYTQRQYPRFEGWNSISRSLLSDNDPTNDLSPAAAQRLWEFQHRRRPVEGPDYTAEANFGGPVPGISEMLGNLRFFASVRMQKEMLLIPLSRDDYRESLWSLKLNSDISKDMKLMITASNGTTRNVALNGDDAQFNNPNWGINGVQFWNPTDYMRTPYQIAEITNEQRSARIYTNSWYDQAVVNDVALSAKLTNFITPSTFYEISFENVFRKYSTGPVAPRDLTKKYAITSSYFVDEAPFGYDPQNNNVGIGETGFFLGGAHASTSRDSTKTYSYVLKGDLTSQITKENLLKAGVEFSYYDLNLNYAQLFFGLNGYTDANTVKQKWNPYRVSAYVQDKIEALGFIANLGVRMDLSNPNTEWENVDPFDPNFYSAGFKDTTTYPKTKSKVDVSFSPRLGISHPITENSKLYFNYGHFKQLTSYEEMFRIGRSNSGQLINIGDPNLVQAKTVSYELGYDHVLLNSYLIQIAAFYNDVTNQQAFTQYNSPDVNYFMANNNNYEDIRGLEITMKKTEGDWIRGFASFTYQVNTQGAFGRTIIDQNPGEQKRLDQITSTLYQQKPVPQPRARLSLTFLTPRDFGPEFLNMYPLSGWTMNLLGDWKAGEYITFNPNNVKDVINNIQLKDFFNLDLRLNKTFNFSSINLLVFVEVHNLLNLKRLSGASFYDTYDQSYYLSSLHLPENPGYTNIPGNDRVGEYRKEGVAYQPVEILGTINSSTQPGVTNVIYWEKSTGKYMEYVNNAWSEVDQNRMKKVLDDKAYIDMPNNSSFDFLNPRQIFFGVSLSF